MATGTGPFESQDIDNRLLGYAGTSQDATPWYRQVQPAYYRFQLDGGTFTGSGVGTTTTGLGGFRQVEVYVRGSTATGTVSTMDVYIDSRLDGTNYSNLAHLTQVTSATFGTAVIVAKLIKSGGTGTVVLAGGESLALDADAGAGTVRNIGWGDDLRIRRSVSGGTTNPTFAYTVWVNASS